MGPADDEDEERNGIDFSLNWEGGQREEIIEFGNGETRKVCNLSLEFFRSRLIELFDILFQVRKIII
jgi:hypothetical protein